MTHSDEFIACDEGLDRLMIRVRVQGTLDIPAVFMAFLLTVGLGVLLYPLVLLSERRFTQDARLQ